MKYKLMATFAVVLGMFIAAAGSALASSQHSLYGQCGGASHNGAQLVNAWKRMGVLNADKVHSIVSSAGWTSMDGSVGNFVSQRGREFQLAQAAWIEDFGCQPGTMFSVGMRHYGAGEWVIGIVPAQFMPGQVSGHPKAGYQRRIVWVHVVGRGNCSNGFRKFVRVVAYVKIQHKKSTKPKPKPHPKPKPKPAPKPTPKGPAAACITTAGVPLYAPLPSGVSVVNGVCTTTTTVTTQTCKEGQTVSHDSNGNMICVETTNTNTNTITVPVTVVVTPPAPAPCGCTPPPAPTPAPTPPPPAAPSVTITSLTTLNDIPQGRDSGQFPFTVNASAAGSVTVDGGVGSVSDCNGGGKQSSITLGLSAGNNNLCVIFYAPSDSSVTSMTVSFTAIVTTSGGTAKDVKNQSFPISQPTRPS